MVNSPKRTRIVEVLGAAGQHLGNDEIAAIDERHGNLAEVGEYRPIEKFVFQSRSREHDIEACPSRDARTA
jgi:hypothetical protein